MKLKTNRKSFLEILSLETWLPSPLCVPHSKLSEQAKLLDLKITDLYHSIQEIMLKTQVLEQGIFREGNAFFRGLDLALKNGKIYRSGNKALSGWKMPFFGGGIWLWKMEHVQVWELGIFGVGNAYFRRWYLALEYETCQRHFSPRIFLISGPKMTSSTTRDFCLLKTRTWKLAIFDPESLKT